jgi:type IV secretion system protein VirB4
LGISRGYYQDMLLFLKKKTDESEKPAEATASDPSRLRDFIPFHSHYNPHTLLTKNGELMQIIKISTNNRGLDYESGDSKDGDDSTVRETIRRAILETLATDRMSMWIHTVRKRRPIQADASFKEPFARYVHERWQEKHNWKHQYYNEIYITLLHDGQPGELLDKKALKRVILPKSNRRYRNEFLDNAYTELDQAVSTVLEKIRVHYNAQRLSIVERIPPQEDIPLNQAIFYSEPMEFLGSVLNLRPQDYPLPDADVSDALSNHSLTFGFNALEAKSPGGKRRFAAVLTLKHYREVPAETADRILQAPIEFIITEAFHFIPAGEALKQYREQKDLFDMSEDVYAIKTSGLDEMLRANRKQVTDFGRHQISIMVLVDDYKQLDAEAAEVQSAFGELGLLTIREDIRLEECFWAQLPGNFEFLRRTTPINSQRMAGFCRLNRFPAGTEHGNHWGDALMLVPTMVNAPYFLNLHEQDNGHAVVMDFNSFNDHAGTILMNFLLSETRKYNGRLYLFDRDHSAQLFFSKLGGDYHTFPSLMPTRSAPSLRLNPFSLEDTPRNQSFLLAWCSSLVASEIQLTDQHKDLLRAAIVSLYARPAGERSLAGLVHYLSENDLTLSSAFAKWIETGIYGGIFDAKETFDLKHLLHAFDMTPVVQHRDCIIPVFSYLLHRIIAAIDGRPTTIVLHEAVDLLENPFFAPR